MLFFHGALMSCRPILILLLCQAGLWAQAPTWATVLPQAQGRLFAVGVVPLQEDEAGARMKAGQLARLELLLTLRAKAQGTVTTQTGTLRTWDEGSDSSRSSFGAFATRMDLRAFAEALPGLEIQEVAVDRGPGQVFALAVLDLVRARAVHDESGRTLQSQIAASLTEPVRNAWKDRLSRFMEGQDLAGRFAAWADTQILLAAAGVPADRRGPDPAQLRQLRARAQISVALLETMDLPVDLVTGLHTWRSRRGLATPSPLGLSLAAETTSEWSQLMNLERVRSRWVFVLSSPDGDRLAVWTFEEQAVGATRTEALQRLSRILLPRVHEALDRWFGFPSLLPPPSLKEAS